MRGMRGGKRFSYSSAEVQPDEPSYLPMIPRVRSHYINAKKLEMLKAQIAISEMKQPLNGDVVNGGALVLNMEKTEILKINVGGRSAQLNSQLLQERHPTGRLSTFAQKSHIERLTECDSYFEHSEEYYFERSPIIFEYIIDFYITGRLHRPMDVCPIRLRYELDFWRIPVTMMSVCCRFEDGKKAHGLHGGGAQNESVYIEVSCPPKLFEKVWMGKERLVAWTFFENPRSSTYAKALSIVSAVFVLASLAGLILSSMPEFQQKDKDMAPHWALQWLEICCMLWFSLEYICRFIIHPNKCDFVKQALNVIDLMTIVPFAVEECMPSFDSMESLRNLRGAMVVIRVLRLARVARIFKLARYSIGLRAFGETMKKSAAELSMLGMFLLTGIMLFSTAIYFFERDEPNSKFYSIPSACWWCIVTMTTVGYGDLVPVTAGGKVVAAMASVCGIIVLAFPISMIIDKFAESTGEWYGDDLVMNMNHHRRNDPKFKSELSPSEKLDNYGLLEAAS
uniref:BTB domain-containing protein n=1 Tax=Panagrellus redivivus TaxID=6233 RepID=A0A7E4UYT2_PANRE